MSPPEPPMNRPELTLTDAAKACDVSRITIRRRLDAGAFPNAHQKPGPKGKGGGTWLIPVEDLIAADFHLHALQVPEPDPVAVGERAQEPEPDLRAELERQREELARARAERDLYQALAQERQTALTDLRMALRALEAPRPVIVEVPKRRRRLFRRNAGNGSRPIELTSTTTKAGDTRSVQ